MARVGIYALLFLLALPPMARGDLPKVPVATATAVRDFGALRRLKDDAKDQETRRVCATLDDLAAATGGIDPDLLIAYRAECHRLQGDNDKASALVTQGLKLGLDVPELLQLKIGLSGRDNRAEAKALANEWGRILPLTSDGQSRDSALGRELVPGPGRLMLTIDWPLPPAIPVKPEPLREIARLWEQKGRYREAVNTYLELSYAFPSWLHYSENTDLFLRVAMLETLMGERELALRAYLRAQWYRGRDGLPIGEAVVKAPGAELKAMPPEKLDKETVEKLARLYADENLHPFALAVLREAKSESGIELPDLEREIRAGWNEVLAALKRSLKNPAYIVKGTYIFGLNVDTVTDWGTVKVLRPSDTFWKPAHPEKR